jgi:hypothetical protein
MGVQSLLGWLGRLPLTATLTSTQTRTSQFLAFSGTLGENLFSLSLPFKHGIPIKQSKERKLGMLCSSSRSSCFICSLDLLQKYSLKYHPLLTGELKAVKGRKELLPLLSQP